MRRLHVPSRIHMPLRAHWRQRNGGRRPQWAPFPARAESNRGRFGKELRRRSIGSLLIAAETRFLQPRCAGPNMNSSAAAACCIGLSTHEYEQTVTRCRSQPGEAVAAFRPEPPEQDTGDCLQRQVALVRKSLQVLFDPRQNRRVAVCEFRSGDLLVHGDVAARELGDEIGRRRRQGGIAVGIAMVAEP